MDIDRAYGGYQIVLTGKRCKNKPKWRKNSLGSGCASVTTGYPSATKALSDLYRADSRGWLRSSIRHYEKYK